MSFILKLLTPIPSEGGKIAFLQTTISEFHSKENVFNSYQDSLTNLKNNKSYIFQKEEDFCFSFNEKLSIHQNGQKDFSFSMLRKIWQNDQEVINPFVGSLITGTQLLLIDQFGNEYFFTIKNVKFTFKNQNVIYDYTCQDSFTYQLIRQNDGYTIDNNSESENFIGAKDIDWWVINKIQPECYIGYNYVPLFQGLALDTAGNLHTFLYESELNTFNVKKIIKSIYSKNKFPEYYELLPFSVSGSNASSSLLSLGEMIGLTLNFRENNIKQGNKNSNMFDRFFWFEPSKNEEISGLKYSPEESISSFGLTYEGASLTTILNVEANTINDEVVGLIPEVPLFFKNLFQSREWLNSTFFEGYFTGVCQGVTYKSKNSASSEIFYNVTEDGTTVFKNNGYLFIKLWNNPENQKFFIPFFYDLISFTTEEDSSYFYINGDRYTPRTSIWNLCIKSENEYIVCNDTFSPIPTKFWGKEQEVYLRISFEEEEVSVETTQIILNFKRQTTSDELEFAEIADKCPWLENKLINLEFFLKQGIISKYEYNYITSLLRNDLRIINGQLLLATSSYYEAIHTKTKVLSEVINDLDSLGASFNSDVISSYMNNGSVDDIKYFKEAYDTLVAKYYSSVTSTPLANYDDILTEYLNKYFKAQQRYLKNVYNFKTYFNSPFAWGSENSKLYKYTIQITIPENTARNTESELRYVNLSNNQFSIVDSNFELYNNITGEPYTQIFDSNKTSIVEIVDSTNYKDYFTPLIEEGSLERCGEKDGYHREKTYYRRVYRTEKIQDSSLKTFSYTDATTNKTYNYVWYKDDEDYSYYGRDIPDSKVPEEDWVEEIYAEGRKFILDYVEMPYLDIISEYLYKKAYNSRNKNIDNWFYHEKNTLKKTTNWLVSSNNLFNKLKPIAWIKMLTKEDMNTDLGEKVLKKSFFGTGDPTTYWEFYYKKFPITELVLKDQPVYKEEAFNFTYGEKTYKTSYQRVNQSKQNVQEYIEYWRNKKQGIDVAEVKNPTLYVKDYTIPLVTLDNESSYYRRVITSANIQKNFTPKSLQEIIKHVIENSETTWALSGVNTKYADNTSMDNFYQGYFNFEKAVYTTSPTAWDEYQQLTKERTQNDFIGIIKETKTAPDNQDPIEVKTEDGKTTYTPHNVKLANIGEKYLVSEPTGLNIGKNYFDKYALLGLTYSMAQLDNNLFYKDSWLRPLKLTDPISSKGKYYILIQSVDSIDLLFNDLNYLSEIVEYTNIRFSSVGRFSKILYYPIFKNAYPVDSIFSEKIQINEGTTVNSFLKEAFNTTTITSETNSYWLSVSYEGKNTVFLFLQEEDFDYVNILTQNDFTNNVINSNKRFSFYEGKDIYDSITNSKINLPKQEDLVEGLYYIPDKDSCFDSVKKLGIEWDSLKHYYKKEGNNFNRVFTIEQIKKLKNNPHYYLNTLSYQFESIDPSPQIDLTVYLNTIIKTNNTVQKYSCLEHNKKHTFKYNNGSSVSESLLNGSDSYTLQYTMSQSLVEDLSLLKNGEFWYKYHTKTESPLLFEKAAIIETQLTTYWQQAYNASLYCEYFLPEHWQPRISGQTNHFVNKIFNIIEKDDKSINIQFSSTILPDVSISMIQGELRSPTYQWKYETAAEQTPDSIKQTINQTNKNVAKSLEEITVFKNAFGDVLGESFDNLIAEELPYKTTYYEGNGGLKWKDIIPLFSSYNLVFEKFNGLYIMTYDVLKNNFFNQSFNNYKRLQEEKKTLWNDLYQEYSGILLESVFSNTEATTPQELYILASNSFKDKAEPEKGYSISIIDSKKIFGFQGQELKVGLGIEVNADEFYDNKDYLQDSLSQYLFITDISYDLRKPSEVQLTVNSIKYQDKLIQRLARLIK